MDEIRTRAKTLASLRVLLKSPTTTVQIKNHQPTDERGVINTIIVVHLTVFVDIFVVFRNERSNPRFLFFFVFHTNSLVCEW